MQYNDSYNEVIFTYANNINTEEGGSHLEGFKNALTKVVNDYGKKYNVLKDDDKLSGDDVREERVSESTFSGGWYNPVLVKINGESYVFYCDNTEKGAYYLACINTANTVIEEDADYNGTPDRFYLDGAVYIAEKTLGDKAKEVEVALDSVYEDSKVKFTEEDGVLTFAEYDKAKAIFASPASLVSL